MYTVWSRHTCQYAPHPAVRTPTTERVAGHEPPPAAGAEAVSERGAGLAPPATRLSPPAKPAAATAEHTASGLRREAAGARAP